MAIVARKNRDGSISYQVKVKDPDGKWYPTPAYRLREDALQEEARLVKLKRKGMKVISDDAKTVTGEEYWEVWSVENRTDVSEGWKISQNQMWRDYVCPVIGKLKMKDVDAPVIGRIMNRAKEMGLGDQTRKHVYSLVRSMFHDAVEYYEMLPTSPVKASFHRPKVIKKKRDFLHPTQSWVLLESCRDHYAGPGVWLETLAALRTEAMMGLQLQDVMWEQNQILIRRAWKQKEGRMHEYPKGKDWEYVPMVPALKKYLLAKCKGLALTDFVCRGVKGSMIPYETFLRVLRRLCADAGVPIVTPHELRHSATEIWAQAGASELDIQRLLNHKNASSTKDYMHRTDERLTHIGTKIKVGGSFPRNFPNGKKGAVSKPKERASNVH